MQTPMLAEPEAAASEEAAAVEEAATEEAAAGGQDASSANNSRSLDKVTTRNHFHSFILLHSHITALQVFCMI